MHKPVCCLFTLLTAILAFTASAAAKGLLPAVSQLQPGTGAQHYAAPNGKSDGNGSKDKPWDLATALSTKEIKPGDTLWLRGGIYDKDAKGGKGVIHCTLRGEAGKPIMVAQCPGERATVMRQVSLMNGAGYTWFWNFEFSSQAKTRNSNEPVPWRPGDIESNGLDVLDNATVEGPGLKFINMTLHDTNSCALGLWLMAKNAEMYGCVAYYNGWQGPSGDRNHGHGLYTQNKDGIKRIADNIFFKNYALGTQLYGSGSAFIDGYDYIGNISFNSGAIGGKLELNFLMSPENCSQWHFDISQNMFYQADANRTCAVFGYPFHKKPYEHLVANDNYIYGPAFNYWWKEIDAKGNTFISEGNRPALMEEDLPEKHFVGAKFDRKTNAILDKKPGGVKIFVRPNEYTAGRANIAIYNWDRKDKVEVDLKTILKKGQAYEIRDVQNFFGKPVVKGVYAGRPVAIPMKLMVVADPIGTTPDPLLKHTAPEFGAFVVMPAGSLGEYPSATPVKATAPSRG